MGGIELCLKKARDGEKKYDCLNKLKQFPDLLWLYSRPLLSIALKWKRHEECHHVYSTLGYEKGESTCTALSPELGDVSLKPNDNKASK